MRRVLTMLISIVSVCAIAGSAKALTQTANLNVSATVPAECTVRTTPVNFGNTVFGYGTGNGDVTVNCPLNTPYKIALGGGNNPLVASTRRMKHSGLSNEYISYVLRQPNGLEWGDSLWENTYNGEMLPDTGTGVDQSHQVAAESFYDTLTAAGTYQDTVRVTVLY